MDVFHIPAQAVMMDDAHKALVAQDELMQAVLDKLTVAVTDQFAHQDLLAGEITRKLKRAVTTTLNKQGKLVDAVGTSLVNTAAQQMAAQADAIAQIQGKTQGAVPAPTHQWFGVCYNGAPLVLTQQEVIASGLPQVQILAQFATKAEADAWAQSPAAKTMCLAIPPDDGGLGGKPCATTPGVIPSQLVGLFGLPTSLLWTPGAWYAVCCPAGDMKVVSAGAGTHPDPSCFYAGPYPTQGAVAADPRYQARVDACKAWHDSCVAVIGGGGGGTGGGGTGGGGTGGGGTGGGGGGGGGTGGGGTGGGGGGGGGDTGPVCCPPETLTPAPKYTQLNASECKIGGVTIPIMPSPGTEEWCQLQEQILTFWVDVGQAIIGLYRQAFNMLRPADDESGRGVVGWFVEQTIPGAAVANGLLQWLMSIREDYWVLVEQFVKCSEALAAALPGCNPLAVSSLWTVKSILTALEKFRIGTDAALWATLDIRFRPKQILQMLDYLIAAACPTEVPSIDEAMHAYKEGQINTKTYECWVRMHGGNPDVWQSVLTARSEKLGSKELIEWSRRQSRPDAQAGLDLLEHGWLREDDRAKRLELFDELPTISDHLHWLQRNVFDTQYVADYQLMQGFDDKFWPLFGHDLRARGMKKEYAALHYAAHWLQPSPTQMQEFVWRLRPDAVGEAHVFTVTDFERLLMEQDYAPLARQWFVDTVYRRLAPGASSALYRNNSIDTGRLVSAYKDFGYESKDAEALAANDAIDKARSRASASRGFVPSSLGNLYRAGLITDGEVYSRMEILGYTNGEADDMIRAAALNYQRSLVDSTAQLARRRLSQALTTGYSAGIIDAQTAANGLMSTGFTAPAAAVVVQSLDIAEKAKLASSLTATMRKAYLRGELSDVEASQYLAQAGITQQHIVDLLLTWKVERAGTRAQLSASQVVRLFNEGMIPQQIAAQRLRNLGWQDPDIVLLLQEAGLKVSVFARMKQSEQNKLVADLKRQEPVGELKKWYKAGKIPAAYVRSRMMLYNYAQSTIDRYLAQWDSEIAQAAQKELDRAAGRPTSLKSGLSHAELKAALKGGQMTEGEIRGRLATEGYDPGTVDILIREWAAK